MRMDSIMSRFQSIQTYFKNEYIDLQFVTSGFKTWNPADIRMKKAGYSLTKTALFKYQKEQRVKSQI